MKSTLENPLAFFEYIIDEVNIKKVLEDHLKFSDYISFDIELPNNINYVEEEKYGNIITRKTTVERELIPILRNQFETSKKLMKDAYLNYESNQNRNFLNIQFNTIQSLIKRKTNLINKYPYLLLPFRGLVVFINDKLLYPEMNEFELNEDGIQYEPSSLLGSFVQKSNIDIIQDVLGYMRGQNEKRETILRLEDFNQLIEYTIYLIEQEKVPEIKKQLNPRLTNELIRFTFSVLHKELYTSKRIRIYFYDFIKSVFESFKNTDIKSIRSQFGTKPRIYPQSFIPEIIKKYME